MLEGRMVCLCAWCKIYGTFDAAFMKYKQPHRLSKQQEGREKSKPMTIQTQPTMESIIRMYADQIPHQMKGTQNRCHDF